MSILKLENVGYRYKDAPKDSYVFKNVNYEFEQGKMYAIKGKSGSGKTTLLSLITGLEKCTDGKVLYDGKDLKKMNLDTYRNTDIGIVFQSYNLIPHQTVLANVELALTISGVGKAERKKKAIEALQKVGLGDQLNKKPNQMSGGQMQRVAIARALVNDPDILLADEPTGALDSHSSQMLLSTIQSINEQLRATILMVTHDAFTASYANRILFLKDGEIFMELRKGNDSRSAFFDKILNVLTMIGGGQSHVC